jgi:hypothetical protein
MQNNSGKISETKNDMNIVPQALHNLPLVAALFVYSWGFFNKSIK